MVVLEIDKVIKDIEKLLGSGDLKALGKKIIKYGVKEEDYPFFIHALINTMQKGLQDKCTRDVKDAWIKACKVASESMISNNYEIISHAGSEELNS